MEVHPILLHSIFHRMNISVDISEKRTSLTIQKRYKHSQGIIGRWQWTFKYFSSWISRIFLTCIIKFYSPHNAITYRELEVPHRFSQLGSKICVSSFHEIGRTARRIHPQIFNVLYLFISVTYNIPPCLSRTWPLAAPWCTSALAITRM